MSWHVQSAAWLLRPISNIVPFTQSAAWRLSFSIRSMALVQSGAPLLWCLESSVRFANYEHLEVPTVGLFIKAAAGGLVPGGTAGRPHGRRGTQASQTSRETLSPSREGTMNTVGQVWWLTPGTQHGEPEVGGSPRVQGQPGLHKETLTQKSKTKPK